MELYGIYTDICVPAVDDPARGTPTAEGPAAPRWQFTRRQFDPIYRSSIPLIGDATPFPQD